MSLPTEQQVLEALSTVIDPELGLNVVDLGLVYDVEISPEGFVNVTHTMTSPHCPIGEVIAHGMELAVRSVPGVTGVETILVFSPPWDFTRLTEKGRRHLGMP